MARTLGDCLTLRAAFAGDEAHVAIGMGPRGVLTRLCPWLFGSRWTYGGAAAPGQVPASDLLDLYRVRAGSASTRVYAVVGAPLAHSASPAMHNAAFASLGMDAVYVPLETDDIDEFLRVAEAIDLAGASVTAPLKPAAFQRARAADDLSVRTGASNTLKRNAGGWEARNYDAAGFLAPLDRRGIRLTGARAVVLGAGGAARTAAWALKDRGAHVALAARRADRREALSAELGVTAIDWPPAPGWDLLVNTTPVGTWPDVAAAPIERALVRGARVYDLVYNPVETTLLAWAKSAGADVIGGLEMLVSQACCQFEWWTETPAPGSIMSAAAETFVTRRGHVRHDTDHV